MTVNQLIKKLQKLPPEMGNKQVIVSADSEGNSYSPVADLSPNCYCEDSKNYYIEGVYSEDLTFEENGFESEKEWEEFKAKMDQVVVLYPTN